ANDKGKGIIVELEKPLKKKDQIELDEEVARKLEAQMKAKIKEEERIAREKDEANIDTNQAAKIEKLKKRVKNLEGMKKKRTHGLKRLYKVGLCVRVESSKDEEVDDTQGRMNDQDMFGVNDLDGDERDISKRASREKSFVAIKKMFDKVYKRVNTFVDMNTEIVEESLKKTQAEVTEDSSKREGDEIEQESEKRQMLEKKDDTAELKRCLEIVLEDDDDVTIEATPLSFKSPTIVDYKIYKEGKKRYFKIIRAYENSQNYLTFGTMFKNFNREDFEVLRSIVKTRFEKTKPVNDMDNLLF
nr:hypothetical protein [Tanacetum cinerariifolium]